jgi:beta-lactamase regulating signal transducer with metallopeptidase domain
MSAWLDVLLWNALEASVLAGLVAVVVRLARPGAPLRHFLWLLVIAKLFVPPFALHSVGLSGACGRVARLLSPTSPAGGGGDVEEGGMREKGAPLPCPPVELTRSAFDDLPSPAAEGGMEIEWELEPDIAAEAGGVWEERAEEPPAATIISASGDAPDPPSSAAGVPAWKSRLPAAAFSAWLLGALAMALRQGARIARLRRALRRSTAAPAALERECLEVAARLGLARPPPLRVLEHRLPPMVWACGRPLLIVPAEIARSRDRALWRGLLAHELAHVKRRDHWAAWLELLGMCAYWWLPPFWLARRRLRQAADQAADAWAVWVLGGRKAYARSLLEVIELLSASPPALPALGQGLGARETVARRLTMIIREPLCRRLSWRGRLAALALGLLVLPQAGRPLGAQADPAAESAVEPAPAPKASPSAPVPPPQEAVPAPAAPAARPAPEAAPALPVPPLPPQEIGIEPPPKPRPPQAAPGRTGRLPPATATVRPSSGIGAAAPAPAGTEHRLRNLEDRMAEVLEELRALRGAIVQPPQPVRPGAADGSRYDPYFAPRSAARAKDAPVELPRATAPRERPAPALEREALRELGRDERRAVEELERDLAAQIERLTEEHHRRIRQLHQRHEAAMAALLERLRVLESRDPERRRIRGGREDDRPVEPRLRSGERESERRRSQREDEEELEREELRDETAPPPRRAR